VWSSVNGGAALVRRTTSTQGRNLLVGRSGGTRGLLLRRFRRFAVLGRIKFRTNKIPDE
jgi:hypothetical protein